MKENHPCPECGQVIVMQRETLKQLQRRYTLQVLDEQGGNRKAAIRILGIPHTTFYRWLNRWKKEADLAELRRGRTL